jgi:hypothetical protein
MVGMGGHCTLRPEGHENLRTILADLPGEVAYDTVQVLAMEFAVGVI